MTMTMISMSSLLLLLQSLLSLLSIYRRGSTATAFEFPLEIDLATSPQREPPTATATRGRRRRTLGKWKDGPDSTEIDCSLSPHDYEYYIERCHDATTEWWVNGRCKDGAKEEVSELHKCARSDGSRSHCHDCRDPRGGGGLVKHVCGSDTADEAEACGIAFDESEPPRDCGDERLVAYSHQCRRDEGTGTSTTSWYLRESHRCEEGEVRREGPNEFACGEEWYYAFKEDEHPSGEEHPFASPDHGYCLDCGLAIQVCVGDGDATCATLGLDDMSVGGDNSQNDGDGARGGTLPAPILEGEEESNLNATTSKYYPDVHRSAWITHGALGSVAFGLLVPCAIIISNWNPNYVWVCCIHGRVHILTFVATFVTVIAAIYTMNGMGDAGEGHMKEQHHITGFLLLLLVSFQTAQGFLLRRSLPIPRREGVDNYVTEQDGSGTGTILHPTIIRARQRDAINERGNLSASSLPLLLWLFIFGLGAYQVRSGLALFAKRFGTVDYGLVYIAYTAWLIVAVLGKMWLKWKGRRKNLECGSDNEYDDSSFAQIEIREETTGLKW